MKRAFTCLSFIAFASLSSVWGNSLQARAANGGCSGYPVSYQVVSGDTLSAIAQSAYGNGTRPFYERIAAATNLQDPNLILVGQMITIPCLDDNEPAAFVAPVHLPEEIPAAFIASVPPSVATAVSLPFTVSLPEYDFVSPPVAPVQPEPSVTAAAIPAPTPALAAPARKLTAGRYQFELKADAAPGITAGTFPALSIDRQEKSGLWRKEVKTVAVVTATETGTFTFDVEAAHVPTIHSAVVIDFGNGNLARIPGDIVGDGKLVNTHAPKTHFKKHAYVALETEFMKKPSKSAAFARRALPIALPAVGIVLAYATVGTSAAAFATIPVARTLVMSKVQQLQRRAQPPQENPPPRVQYVLGTQDAQIRQLEKKIEVLQKQLDSLGQTEAIVVHNSEKEGQ